MTDFNEDLLRLYYERLFPAEMLCKWLDHDKMTSLLAKREFSFTLAGDIYIRYLSFNNSKELLREIKRKQPHKIDIGAVYNIPPNKHNSVRASSFKPRERELVFDIDLTDYEPVMGPKQETESIWGVNSSKWIYMSTAMKVVSQILKEDFGFENFIWIFSGRRGVHCWVNDEKAREMIDKKRSQLMKYMTVLVGNKIELKFPLHPNLNKFLPLLSKTFDRLCETDEILLRKENIEVIMNMIPDNDIKQALTTHFSENDSNSVTKWNQIKSTIMNKAKKASFKDSNALKACITKIIFYFTYPRLDVNVSTHKNHLLKSPFVAHPKTGKICVPIKDGEYDEFDPEAVPTLKTLMEELNETGNETSLEKYKKIFQEMIDNDKDSNKRPTFKNKLRDIEPMENVETSTHTGVPTW